MKTIDPVTWHLIEEAAKASEIELRPLEGRSILRVRSPQGAGNLLRFFCLLQPWMIINQVFVPEYTPESEYLEFGAELLPR